jgi:sulfur-carrier protein
LLAIMEPDQSAGTMLNEMSVSVLLFASYADAFGTKVLSVPVQPPCAVADVVAAMRSLPGGNTLPPRPLVALNQEWLHDHAQTVRATDELAVIPPVAGG